MEQYFDRAGENRGQSDRNARFEHVYEGVSWRGIGVRAHKAADVVREVPAGDCGDGALIRDLVRIDTQRLAWPDLLRCGSQLLGQTNRQELIQPDSLVGLVKRVGCEIARRAAAPDDPLAERPKQGVFFVSVEDREGLDVCFVARRNVAACTSVRQHRDDHLGNVAEVRDLPRKIDPARHVVGRQDALHLLDRARGGAGRSRDRSRAAGHREQPSRPRRRTRPIRRSRPASLRFGPRWSAGASEPASRTRGRTSRGNLRRHGGGRSGTCRGRREEWQRSRIPGSSLAAPCRSCRSRSR